MTTDQKDAVPQGHELAANLEKIEALSQRLIQAMGLKRRPNPALEGPGAELYAKAMAAYWAEMAANPAKILEQQISFWGKSVKHYVEAGQVLARGKLEAPPDPTPKDRRFANPLWESHP